MSAVRSLPDDDRGPAMRPRRDPLRLDMVVLLLVASVLTLSMGDGADPDLWGHVRYGQDVLATGQLPATATHTFTAVGTPWINHENIAEIVFAAIANHAGGPGLMVLKDVLGLVVVGLLVGTAYRHGASLLVTALVVVLVGFSIQPGWSVRPQVFTYTFFAILVWLLDVAIDRDAPAGRIGRAIWLVPVVFAVWVNTHGGFLAGLGIAGIYVAARAGEMLWTDGRRAFADIGKLAAALAASGLALLANPYGPALIVWLVRDRSPPRPEISEWHGLVLTANTPTMVFVALLALTVVATIARRRRDVPQLVVLAVAAWQAVEHTRHIPFFAILAGFWLPPALEELRARLPKRERTARPPAPAAAVRRIRLLTRAVTLLILAGMAFHSRALWVRKNVYPVEAIDYMGRHHLTGKLLAHFDWAQYALAAFAPETTVAFDGRFRTCYPQAIADMHFDFLIGDAPDYRWRDPTSPPIDEARALSYGDPELVLIPRADEHAVRVVAARPEWVLLYQDGLAQVWGRRNRYDDPASQHYVARDEREITDREQTGWAAWPAFPSQAS